MKLVFRIEKPYEGTNEITITNGEGRCYQQLREENALLQYQDAQFIVSAEAWQAFVNKINALNIPADRDISKQNETEAEETHWNLQIEDAAVQINTAGGGTPPPWFAAFCATLKQLIGPLSFSA